MAKQKNIDEQEAFNAIYRIDVVLTEKKIKNHIIAKLMDTDRETISRWRNNKTQPTRENLYKLAKLLRVNLQELHIKTDWSEGPSEAEIAQAEYDKKQKAERLKNSKAQK